MFTKGKSFSGTVLVIVTESDNCFIAFDDVILPDTSLFPLQVSYAIGVAEPLSIFVSSYGTGVKSDDELLKIVKNNFDLRPGRIVR